VKHLKSSYHMIVVKFEVNFQMEDKDEKIFIISKDDIVKET
jgi:hypothetical protein